MTSEYLLCYNKGCGIKFDPLKNDEESCCFHPGAPIFHDAYKGWSCCNKRSTDFTTFLNTRGCSRGKHNPVKPEEPTKIVPSENKDEIIVVETPKPSKLSRAEFTSPLKRLFTSVAQSLTAALECEEDKQSSSHDKEIVPEAAKRVGEPCKNNACKEAYEGEHSDLEMCQHHPGFPIFHEGMKFWTCCNRKTSDFNSFLEQVGCATGSHLWVKKSLKKEDCRFDWHQTATYVCVTIYAKFAQPDNSSVDANPIRLVCNIVFGENCSFDSDWELQGIIDPSQSSVSMAASKVEVKLKKAEPFKWSNLFIVPQKREKDDAVQNEIDDVNVDPDLDVDAINLDDI